MDCRVVALSNQSSSVGTLLLKSDLFLQSSWNLIRESKLQKRDLHLAEDVRDRFVSIQRLTRGDSVSWHALHSFFPEKIVTCQLREDQGRCGSAVNAFVQAGALLPAQPIE